jgi:hypothetical protein
MLDLVDTTADLPGAALGPGAPVVGAGRRDMLLLPFRIAPAPEVLMLWTEAGWRLPGARRRRGMTAHASAALDARIEASVTGRIFKRAIVCEVGERKSRVYPFLVHEVLPAAEVRGWAAPDALMAALDAELAPLAAFLAKIKSARPPRARSAKAGTGFAMRSRPGVW